MQNSPSQRTHLHDEREVVDLDATHSARKRDTKADSKLPAQDEGAFTNFPEITRQTCSNLLEKGIKSLFPIQQHCFRHIYNRYDIIARDLTGSGKTLGFALPVVEYLRKKRLLGSRKTQAIVLAPTRELALQVANTFQYLKHNSNEFNCLTVYGGVPIDTQTNALRNGVEIFVGTTGRVLDHIERGNIDFSDIKTIILDEADQMLKLGFKEDIEKILGIIRRQIKDDLQICLFSATVPAWIKDIASQHMKRNMKTVDLAQDLANKSNKNIQHLAISCPYYNRMSALQDVLVCYGQSGKTIVFTQTKADANQTLLSDKIKQDVEVMHGDIAQNQREITMRRFKEGKFKCLVATDVASRGLDVPNVDLVIQIEPPKDVETYIHRSGRTARAGAKGVCITFYTEKTSYMIQQIESQAGIKLTRIGIPQPNDLMKATATSMLNNLEGVCDDVLPMFEDAAKLFLSKNRGDPVKALSKTLAFISGNYKQAIGARSLLTGQERSITLQMTSQGQRLNQTTCRNILERGWSGRMADSVKSIRTTRNGQSAVFDVQESDYDKFMETFQQLVKQQGRSIDFQVTKCVDLPELEDEERSHGGGGYQGNRGGYNNNSSRSYESKGRSYGGDTRGDTRGGNDYSRSREPYQRQGGNQTVNNSGW